MQQQWRLDRGGDQHRTALLRFAVQSKQALLPGQIAGDLPWEQRLFGLYREAQERGAMLIAAAVEPPLLLHFALPDLASRFAAAALLPLRPLPEAGQREALRLRAHARGLELPEETALYLQRRFRRDLPTLYHLLDTIDEAALQAQRRLTVPFIRSVLSPDVSERARAGRRAGPVPVPVRVHRR